DLLAHVGHARVRAGHRARARREGDGLAGVDVVADVWVPVGRDDVLLVESAADAPLVDVPLGVAGVVGRVPPVDAGGVRVGVVEDVERGTGGRRLLGGADRPVLLGGAHRAVLFGGAHRPVLLGGAHRAVLFGGAHRAVLLGCTDGIIWAVADAGGECRGEH